MTQDAEDSIPDSGFPQDLGEQTDALTWESADERRRNQRLDVTNRAYMFLLMGATVCGWALLLTLTIGLSLVIVTVALDHTVNDQLLSDDQMQRINTAGIGVRDAVTGSALLGNAVLFWLVRRGWVIPQRSEDD